MNNHRLNNDQSFFILKRICVLLAIIPHYNPRKSNFKCQIWSKMYAIGLLFFVCIGTVCSLYLWHRTYNSFFVGTHKVLNYIDMVIIILGIFIIVISSTILKQNQWFELERKLEELNGIFYPVSKKNYQVYRSIASLCSYLVIDFFAWVMWSKPVKLITGVKTHLVLDIALFYFCVLVELIINLSEILKQKYVQLNKCIRKVKKENFSESLNYILSLSRKLLDIVHCFNKFFDWALFFAIAVCVVKMLKNFNYVVSNLRLNDSEFLNRFLMVNTARSFYFLV